MRPCRLPELKMTTYRDILRNMDGYRKEVHFAHVRRYRGQGCSQAPPVRNDKTASWSTDATQRQQYRLLRRAVTLQAEEPGPREAPPTLPTAFHGGSFHIHLESLWARNIVAGPSACGVPRARAYQSSRANTGHHLLFTAVTRRQSCQIA